MNIGFKRQLYSMKNITNSCISNEKLVKENETLKTQVIDLNSILTKFTKGKENLDRLLGNQCVFDKKDMGYKPQKIKKLYSNYFVKASSKNDFHEKYCMDKNISTKTKYIWVPICTFTNQNRPMKLWIPKSTC
jgi:hypothetical protein